MKLVSTLGRGIPLTHLINNDNPVTFWQISVIILVFSLRRTNKQFHFIGEWHKCKYKVRMHTRQAFFGHMFVVSFELDDKVDVENNENFRVAW